MFVALIVKAMIKYDQKMFALQILVCNKLSFILIKYVKNFKFVKHCYKMLTFVSFFYRITVKICFYFADQAAKEIFQNIMLVVVKLDLGHWSRACSFSYYALINVI